jgi:hypothetical protein
VVILHQNQPKKQRLNLFQLLQKNQPQSLKKRPQNQQKCRNRKKVLPR